MAKYTFELRRLFNLYTRETVEGWFKNYNLEDYLTTSEIQVIQNRGTWSKDKLAKKIVNHYYMNEIGFETAPLFRFYLKEKLNEIMPYYNVLYEKQRDLLSNLGGNVDLTETLERETGSNTSSNSNSKSFKTAIYKYLFDVSKNNLNILFTCFQFFNE